MISRNVSISGTMMCCIFWIFWSAEGKLISKMVGSTVTLACSNKSTENVVQLTWEKNGEQLFVFKPAGNISQPTTKISANQSFKMSTSASELYALIIERAQESHTGNYTCETTIRMLGVFQEEWELLITGEEAENSDKLLIAVAVAVPCVCFLIFISVFIILRRIRKRQAENSTPPAAAAETQQQQPREEIYENCLEIQRRAQANRLKHSTH